MEIQPNGMYIVHTPGLLHFFWYIMGLIEYDHMVFTYYMHSMW